MRRGTDNPAGLVYVRLRPDVAEDLVLSVGFPVFPPPLPGWSVRVRRQVPCPACGMGLLANTWSLGSGAAVVGSSCFRHAFVTPLPAFLRPEVGS